MAKSTGRNTVNPLPSLLRASAWDAGNQSAAKAGRKVWDREDYNAAAATQERLTLSCYGRLWDRHGSKLAFVRFAIAESMEKQGHFTLSSDFAEISDWIDAELVDGGRIPMTA